MPDNFSLKTSMAVPELGLAPARAYRIRALGRNLARIARWWLAPAKWIQGDSGISLSRITVLFLALCVPPASLIILISYLDYHSPPFRGGDDLEDIIGELMADLEEREDHSSPGSSRRDIETRLMLSKIRERAYQKRHPFDV